MLAIYDLSACSTKGSGKFMAEIHTGSLQEEDNERGVAHFVNI